MRFYINYGGSNLGRTGPYAVPVGGYYALAFGLLNDPNSGWSVVEKHPQLPPASGTPISGDVSAWLTGFLGLNSQLETSDYWLCSPAFLASQTMPIGNGLFASKAWPISTNPEGSNQKLDVPVYVGTRLPDGSAPPVDPAKNTTTRPLCIKNGPDIFEAGATNEGIVDPTVQKLKTRYVWCGFASSEPAGGQPPLGNVNLTQEAAGQVVGQVFDGPLGFTGRYMSSGYITASFPYNVMVLSVTKIPNDDGANAYYNWQVVNPTPLWLHNITVRVYTHGKQTGKWNLVAVYQNVDIPPASLDGKIKGSPNNKDIMVSASGVYAIAQPRLYTKVPKPSEPYDTVVTANVDLAVQNGQMGTPVIDQGLRATYWNGNNFVPGLPSNEVPGTQLFDRSQSVLGRTLPNPFGDNVASTSDAGAVLPKPGEGQNNYPNNLAVLSMQVVDAQTGQPVSSPQANQSLNITAKFSSTFNVGGYAKIRLYKYQVKYNRLDEDESVNLYFAPSDVKEYTWKGKTIGEGQYKFIVSIDYYNNGDNPSTGWVSEKFDGKYDEATYDDNKLEQDLTGTEQPPREPLNYQESESVWYPPLTWKETPVYKEITEDVIGWRKIRFEKEEGDKKPSVRLVPVNP